MTLQQTITQLIGGVGVAWYFLCIFVIGGKYSVDSSNQTFRSFMSLSITTIGVALATFIGILLGFRTVSDEVKQGVSEAQATGVDKLNAIATSIQGSDVQWGVAILYIFSLVLALYYWWKHGDGSDPSIINLAKSLLGIVAGALSVLLNIPGS